MMQSPGSDVDNLRVLKVKSGGTARTLRFVASKKVRDLDPGYTSEVDRVNEQQWHEILGNFDDANIFQTWSYGVVTSGQRNVSRLLVKRNGDALAMAQARIAKVPGVNVGIAYVRWGPLWRRRGSEEKPEIFRQVVRALRNEFACKRGLVVRMLPVLFDTDSPCYAGILAEEGFTSLGGETKGRTILMDLSPPLEELREGMRPHWKRELKIAERKALDVSEGSGDDLFASVIDIYREMVSRKRFTEGSDISQFRLMQERLPESLKMRIMVCRSGTGVCAGVVCSAIGKAAVYLFGATSNLGMKSNGSYLLHWKLIEQLKHEGRTVYDLNGINPTMNPGTYKFKSDLAGSHGKDVLFLGQFESHASVISHGCVGIGERARGAYRWLMVRAKTGRGLMARAKM